MQRLLRILRVIIFRYQNDLCALRASALTFNSTLSVVPILAVMFGIAKGFGIDKILEASLREEFRDQEEVIKYLIQFGYTLLDQTRGGLIAGIGIITLFYTVLRLLSTIEDSLNAMWGLKEGRTLPRKVVDFLALILICPIFIVLSSSLTVFVTTQVELMTSSANLLSQIQPVVVQILACLPYVISSLLFTFLYSYMPNTKVQLRSALFAGVVAGVSYQLLQAFYISVQIQVSKTGAIYGSFAALPLFLFWLYLSWMIFLICAEIVVINQEKLWDPEMVAPFRKLSPFEQKLTYLSIVKVTVDAFIKEEAPITLERLSSTLKMPIRLLTQLTDVLVNAKILVRTVGSDDKSQGITLAKDPDSLRVFDILYAIEGENKMGTNGDPPTIKVFEKFIQEVRELSIHSDRNILVKDIQIFTA